MDKSHHVKEVYKLLRRLYPNAITFLDYKTHFQLLVAVVLSAQTTDAQVNKITAVLFGKYPDPEALMTAELADVEKIIRSTGFYKVKARNITGAAKKLVTDYNSEVPVHMEELLTLPGVGRKSANVIRAHCYNKSAIIVDTHFSRVIKRIGFTESSNPEVIENDLLLITDEAIQTDLSMIINIHGRKICTSRNPLCGECILSSICRYSC
jgi:endonuclease III